MSKRKAEDDEDDFASNKFMKKVDTDDDDDDEDEDEGSDDGKKYEILKEDDIEGQEAGIVTHDGDIVITPFNVEEEMEEGHFDAQGMYHWNKEENIRDNWLENIDWVKIKDPKSGTGEAPESESEEDAHFDEIALYEQILPLMQENETVAKALRRLGSTKSLSASERLKRKKAGLAYNDANTNAETVTKLTELANTILSRTGNMDIYQETFEGIQKKITHISSFFDVDQCFEKKKDVPAKPAAELDMYADDFDEKEKANLTTASTSKDDSGPKESKNQEVQWEYKKTLNDDKTEGPYSTEQMNKYMKEDHFKEPVWVRKVGTDSEFYSSRRIDFELYL
ncbi:hypothetical protein V9T40_013347 [Parthenolecanium corni]|uniref:GYF domain-containing protein n=1 Tax=Parthenolecanium corni TaxID=536013 RepID=A0AAN9TLN7_9HEMI